MTYALHHGLAIRKSFEENSIRCLSFPTAKLPTLILIWYIPHKHLTTFIPVLCFMLLFKMFATVGIVLFWALKIKHLSFNT